MGAHASQSLPSSPDDGTTLPGYDGCAAEETAGSRALDRHRRLNGFLAGVERRAFRMACLATGNREEAFDIVQDAMLKLVEKYGDRDEQELGPLFHCILQSRIRDWYRRSSVRNRFRSWLGSDDEEGEDALQMVADPGGRSPEELLMLGGGMAALESALRELPLRQQQAFLLRAWEGLDVRQTAAAMRCAEGSVKTHYSRALHTLRAKLGEHWP